MKIKNPLNKRSGLRLLMLYTAFLLACSLGILAMPAAMELKAEFRALSVISGLLLWVGLIGTIVTETHISRLRRADRAFLKEYGNTPKMGVIRFFKNKAAVCADVVMLISLVCSVVTYLFSSVTVFTVFLAAFVFSFGMHSMLNGINFVYLNHTPRSKRKL